ncbi:MAG: TIGR02452 family protein [Flammeovirgaceae bacterium]
MSRIRRIQIAQDTFGILERGHYRTLQGKEIDIAQELAAAKGGTIHYKSAQLEAFVQQLQAETDREKVTTIFEVTGETTLEAAKRLWDEGESHILALNFASAKNPGGGFLTGAQAQEESLARASGLYPCIEQKKAMYKANKAHHSNLYLDDMIYSPQVPVFRCDDGQLLAPYTLSIVTAPAVNAGAVKDSESHHIPLLEPTMKGRILKLLSLCHQHQHKTLLLGAWGCGVFRNDPTHMASYFKEALGEGGLFHNHFERIVFAILDHTQEQKYSTPFREQFLA